MTYKKAAEGKPIQRRDLIGFAITPLLSVLTLKCGAEESSSNRIIWPDLQLIDGNSMRSGEWSYTPAIVVFWETWCPYCRRQNVLMDRLYHAVQSKNIRILGATTEIDEAKVKYYVTSNALSFPVAIVSADFKRQFTKRRVIPMTCLVSERGTLLQAIPGEMAWEDVQSLPTELLRNQRSST